jgi:ribulose kinase
MVIVRRGHPILGAAIVGGVAYKVGQAGAQKQAAQQAQQQAAAPAVPDMSQKYAQIEQLNRLKQSGALTEEEFQREKQKILGL